MDKKLPKMFANDVDKKFNNNEKVFYSKDKKEFVKNSEKKLDGKNIYQKINDIFSSERYVYKANVSIKTKSGNIITKIIGQNKTHLITMDNELIPITDIEDINLVN